MAKPDERGVIRSLRKQERAYRTALKKVVDIPILSGFAEGLSDASTLAVAIEQGVIAAQENLAKTLQTEGAEMVDQHFIKLSAQHKATFIKRFQRMVRVDVGPLLKSGPIAQALDTRIAVNVDLIKLIGKEHLPKVAADVQKKLKERPFDRAYMSEYFEEQWKYKDYRLRRIARDQTSKSIAEFNQIRQVQLGIESFQWLAIVDSRTRDTHKALNGREFYWNNPPGIGLPGAEIQCRCVAIPIIPDVIAKRKT
ncbi:MAG: minor capsid protein [Gemmatimonadota bacterium]|nr:minor capsid protein [Gemmatimonadota bacterium]